MRGNAIIIIKLIGVAAIHWCIHDFVYTHLLLFHLELMHFLTTRIVSVWFSYVQSEKFYEACV